jgi:hypothetical protein
MLTLPVTSSTLTFDTPFSRTSACLRFSASRSDAHVEHALQSFFEVFRVIFSMVMLDTPFSFNFEGDFHVSGFKLVLNADGLF